jgi:hypothetical protein
MSENNKGPVFEDVPFQAAEPQFEDTFHPEASAERDPADLAPTKSEFDDAIDTGTGVVAGGITGAGIGKGLELLGSGAYKAATSVGPLSREQVNTIEANPAAYKAAPELESILNQWKQLGQKTQKTGLDAADAARQSLQGLPNIPVGKYYEALSAEPSDIKYSTAIDPGTRTRVTDKHFNAAEPDIAPLKAEEKNILSQLQQLEAEQAKPYAGEVDLPAREDQKIVATEKAKELVDQRKLQRKTEEVARKEAAVDAQSKRTQEAYQRAVEKREDFLYNKEVNAEKGKTLQAVKNAKITDDKAMKEQARLEKLQKDLASAKDKHEKVTRQIQKKYEKVAKDAKKEYSKIANIPDEINIPEDRYLRPEYSKQLENAVAKARPAAEVGLEPVVADQLVQELRQGVDYDGQGDQVKNFNKGLAENVRRQVLNETEYPEYNAGMKASSEAQKLQDQMAQTTGLQFDKSPDDVRFADGARNKLGQILLDKKVNVNSAEELDNIFSGLVKNGIISQQEAEAFMKNGEYAAIKKAVETGAKDITGYDIANMAKGPTAIKAGIGQFGGKIQEALAQVAGSDFGKGVSKVMSNLPGAGSVIGAGLGYGAAANAADEGLITPEQAAFAGPASIIEPPLTDSVQSAIEMNQAYNESKAQGAGELEANAKAGLGAVSGFIKPITEPLSNVVPMADKALETGVRKGQELLEEFGKAQSHNARSRMEQNFADKSPVVKAGKALNQATPEQLMELAQSFREIKGADNFVSSLEQAAQAESPEDKQARLFGLYQQPAFRQLLKKGSVK